MIDREKLYTSLVTRCKNELRPEALELYHEIMNTLYPLRTPTETRRRFIEILDKRTKND